MTSDSRRTIDIRRRATFDRSKRYRYSLSRIWNDTGPRVAFCLLNPSTADEFQDDPTIRRCIRFAHDWGFGSAEMVNIFALRSTDPKLLYRVNDPVGPGNDRAIRRVAGRCRFVVAAWGHHGELNDRGRRVLELLCDHNDVRCFGLTRSGHPKHPLYLPRSAPLRPLD